MDQKKIVNTPAPPIEYVLRDQDILKASKVFGVDPVELKKMNDLRLLNTLYMRDQLIIYDYSELMRGCRILVRNHRAYTIPEVMKAIANEWGISVQTLDKILHGTQNKKMFFCKGCGVRIPRKTAERTNGLCSSCFADTLEIL